MLRNAKNRTLAIEEAVIEEETIKTDDIQQPEKQLPPKQKIISAEELKWLTEVEVKTLENIENNNYSINQLASDMAVSLRQLRRKIKELVGVSSREYIKTIRFTKARTLLEEHKYSTVKAVAYSVGFKDVINFSRQFKERFGKSPSEYL